MKGDNDLGLIKSGIYVIKNTLNNKIYIGSAVDLKSRFRIHKHGLLKNKHHSRSLQRFINKYGFNKIYFEVLEFVPNMNELLSREQYYLDNFKPFFNTLTVANSSFGVKRSEETKEKIRKANLGLKHPKWRNELKSKSQGGKNHWGYGKKLSIETKLKKSISMKKKYKEGFIPPRSKKVLQYSLDWVFLKEWDSTKDIERKLNFNSSAIQNNARGKSKTSHGYIWVYKENIKKI